MKALVAVLFLGLAAVAANNEPQQTTIQSRTTQGSSWVVSVGSCNLPMPGIGMIASNFSYSTCQEYVTANYEVSGSGWSKEFKLIPGTETKSYRIDMKQNGHSAFVSEEQVDIFDYLSVTTACQSIRQATAGTIVPVSQTLCAQQQ